MQADLYQDRSKGDLIAPLETKLAQVFRDEGFYVIASYGKRRAANEDLLLRIMQAFHRVFNQHPNHFFNADGFAAV